MYIKYLLYSLCFMMILQGCTEHQDEQEAPKKNEQKKKLLWTTVHLEQHEYGITLPGELKAYEEVNIYPKMKAFVKKIYVDRGTMVRKGQLLAQLEAPEIGAQHAARVSSTNAAYQRYVFSKQSYERLLAASKRTGAVADIELEKAYAQWLGDSAAYKGTVSEASASGQLQQYLRITAPFSGVITSRSISEGALVGENGAASEPMFTLTQENRLRLVVSIPEKQAQSLKEGTHASFTLIDFPGKNFEAKMSRNSYALDRQTKSVVAEFDIDNADHQLRSGGYAKVRLKLKRPQPTIWVPASAVVKSQAGLFVIKKENNKAVRIPVELGMEKDSLLEVFGALKDGESILTKGTESIKDGMKVE